jgi:hypothetical protein
MSTFQKRVQDFANQYGPRDPLKYRRFVVALEDLMEDYVILVRSGISPLQLPREKTNRNKPQPAISNPRSVTSAPYQQPPVLPQPEPLKNRPKISDKH